ncbi:hypothetical protein [Massilia soli]|uniref:Lipoprotein n=1 Tax=Massilia soli TaxID=2792854 RepID=A0ABS7SSB9_9BURK|nr:hypothetical protein [Massilia soli]MBZ2208851.1 hypothetical protein [Massilia soli]
MNPQRAGYLTLAACFLAACTTVGEAPVNDATLTLQPQQTLALGKTISLRYERADDSRCPSDARCVWAGTIVYHFTLVGNTASEPFKLDADQATFVSTSFKGVRIVLATTEPPPVRMSSEPPPPHPVTISVTNT